MRFQGNIFKNFEQKFHVIRSNYLLKVTAEAKFNNVLKFLIM